MARTNNNGHEYDRSRLGPCTSSLVVIVLLMLMMVESDAASGYGPKSNSSEKPDSPYNEQNMLTTTIGVQGVIYCRSGAKLIPLRGALARISCLAIGTRGYETAPFAILSVPADAKGYFFATLSPSEVVDGWRLSECKAFLHSSPSSACAAPTDANRGLSGALLSSYTLRDNGKMKLYSVGPFVYAPGPRPTPTPSVSY